METSSVPADPTIFRVAEEIVRPGDIVQLAPISRAVREHLHVGKEQQRKSGPGTTARSAWLLVPAELPPRIADGTDPSRLVVPGILSWAVLLTRGCDVDNSEQRQLAFLRPLSTFQSDQVQADIIDGKHTSLHFVPSGMLDGKTLFPDSAIDFRFIVTLHKDLFDQLRRPISLTRDAVKHAYLAWIRHTTGRFISISIPCGQCGHLVPVFQELEAMANPADEY